MPGGVAKAIVDARDAEAELARELRLQLADLELDDDVVSSRLPVLRKAPTSTSDSIWSRVEVADASRPVAQTLTQSSQREPVLIPSRQS